MVFISHAASVVYLFVLLRVSFIRLVSHFISCMHIVSFPCLGVRSRGAVATIRRPQQVACCSPHAGLLLQVCRGWRHPRPSNLAAAAVALQRLWRSIARLAARLVALHSILEYVPTTASSAQFCLLCCQPEPIPRSLAARMSRFTPRDPCRLSAWLGQTIDMTCKTCRAP